VQHYPDIITKEGMKTMGGKRRSGGGVMGRQKWIEKLGCW
jgi:hypothetical protein